jgi:uncharacterized protein YjbI with pentapeptide repeats
MEVAWHVWQARPPSPSMTVVVKGTFTLEPDGECKLAPAQALPTGDEHHDQDPERSLRYPSDLEPIKRRGECFVIGSFYAPGGQPVPHSKCAFQVGSVRKQLAIYGDRVWHHGRATPPTPVATVPLVWELAFGGPSIAENPVGRGMTSVVVEGQQRLVLPNIEDPMALLAAREERPRPVGCGPIPRTWHSRVRLAGTYGAAWKEKRYPWFPEDIDWRFFNAAPVDQQIEGFWRGDEEIVLRHLNKDHPSLRCTLPGLRAQAFVVPRSGPKLYDINIQLDTIVIDTDAALLYCVWRGAIDVVKEDLSDLEHLYVTHDEPGKRAGIEALTARYRAKVAAKIEEDQAAQASPVPPSDSAVRRAELIAAIGEATPGAKWAHLDQEMTIRSDDALQSAMRDAMAAKMNALRPIFDNALGSIMAGDSEERKLSPEEELEVAMQTALGSLAGPQEDGRLQQVRAAITSGGSLARRDLSGLDLSGVDFGAIDLRGALLVRTNLSGARFERARLDEAVMTEAELSQASFEGCSLTLADLTSCRGHRLRVHECDLSNATIASAYLRESRFWQCNLTRADMRESDATASEFRNCVLDAADLSKATLESVIMRETSLADTWMEGGVKARRIVLDGCRAPLLRASEEGDFEEASFKKTVLEGARFAGARLRKANFGLAKLSRADFSDAFLLEAVMTGCDLRFARFDRATLLRATLLKSDLMQARFENANLRHADLRGANLYQAELLGAKLEEARLDLAHVAGTRLA